MRIIDDKTKQEVTNPDLDNGYIYEAEWIVDTDGTPEGDVWELVQLYHRWTAEEIAQREEAEREAEKQAEREKLLLTLSEAFSETYEPSDKVGFLWKVVKLGEVEIMREYVTDPDAPTDEDGSYLHPFSYVANMEVIEGFWYTDGADVWECIKSGIPTGFDDTEYFDIITV